VASFPNKKVDEEGNEEGRQTADSERLAQVVRGYDEEEVGRGQKTHSSSFGNEEGTAEKEDVARGFYNIHTGGEGERESRKKEGGGRGVFACHPIKLNCHQGVLANMLLVVF